MTEAVTEEGGTLMGCTLPPGEEKRYALPSGQEVVILTGDVKELRGHKVDAIVSLENTFLQLGRYFDASVSGSLCYMDAKKSEAGEILEDSLSESLKRVLREDEIRLPVRLGTVVMTPTTQLNEDLGVRYVFHFGAMQGSVGDGYKMIGDAIDDCICNAFRRFRRLVEQEPESEIDSLLFPMLGAGTANIRVLEVARQLLRQVVRRTQETRACRTVYVLAWLESHRTAIRKVAAELKLKEVGQEDADDPEARAERPRIAA